MNRTDPALIILVLMGIAVEALAIALKPLLAHALALLLTATGWQPTPTQQTIHNAPPLLKPTKEPPAPVRTATPRRKARKTPAIAAA